MPNEEMPREATLPQQRPHIDINPPSELPEWLRENTEERIAALLEKRTPDSPVSAKDIKIASWGCATELSIFVDIWFKGDYASVLVMKEDMT